MHIAVCTKNEETHNLLFHLFKAYEEKSDCSITGHFFKNSIDLLYDFTGGEYDAVFFSAYCEDRLAQEIREKDRHVRLVQLVETDSVAQDSLDIWHCLPEQPGSAFLFPILDRLFLDVRKDDETGLLIKSKGSFIQLPFSHIEYVEVMGRTVYFYLADGTMEEVSGSLPEFEGRLLHWPDFVKVHRAYILNLRQVQRVESSGVITKSGHLVPVSRHTYPQFKKDYLCSLMDPGAREEIGGSLQKQGDKIYDYYILFVDDEEEQQQYWAGVLTAHGCMVQVASDGKTAIECAVKGRFDCVVLDVKLGSERGFDLCSALMERTGAPVIFLSSLDDSGSQTQGFMSGGIDYITKDATDELFWLKIETRIKMVKAAKAELIDGTLRLNLKDRTTFFEGKEVPLTAVEFDILSLLMRNPSTVYTPSRIYEAIWGIKPQDSGQAVQMHLSLLERKLETYKPGYSFIKTVWGKGYRFIPMSEKKGDVNENL